MKFVCVCILLFTAANIQAQVQDAVTPFSGMANASHAVFSPWCVFSNQAGISRIDKKYAGISYRHVFDLKELSTKSVFAAVPTKWGAWGATYTHFGYEQYSEQMVGLVYGKQLAKFLDIGVKVDYLFSKVAKQPGSRQSFFFETGFIFSLPYRIVVGVHTSNPGNIARLTAPEQLYVAEKYTAGVSWKPDEVFTIATQLDMVDSEALFSAGVEYVYRQFLTARAGFRTGYNSVYAGLGGVWNRFELSVNYNTHIYLGNLMSFCLMVQF